jgi:hypothetical protein
MANIQTVETRSKFGVPVTGATGSGILMPKLKYRFRVTFLGGFAGEPDARVLTQNVMSVTRPKLTHEVVTIDSYNSKMYVQGKHEWDQVTITFRDDITNAVTRLVGAQEQRQLNHFQQTTPAAGNDYKFDMHIEILDGVNAGASEVWFLEGCFMTNIDYDQSEYTTSEPVTISMQVRFDNATHYQGDNDVNGRVDGGNPFPDQVDLNPLTGQA